MGWTSIEQCCACGAEQENSYSGGFVSHVVHCSGCGAETWLGYYETPGPCKKCGGEVLPDGEPVCKQCGGREWIIPEGRERDSQQVGLSSMASASTVARLDVVDYPSV
jgi:hypothetical protein